jgi:hypothetical protein
MGGLLKVQKRVNEAGSFATSIGGILEISGWLCLKCFSDWGGSSEGFHGFYSRSLALRELNLLESAASLTIGYSSSRKAINFISQNEPVYI